MKTLKDLEDMKKIPMIPFENQYDYLFATLENYYIAKLDGISRIEKELNGWDKEAQKFIVNKLADIISEDGVIGFDRNEILSLVKLEDISNKDFHKEKIDKLNCYIEEYKNEVGSLCARLRDKASNKKVSITGTNANKEHLLSFLSQAKLNLQMMPTVFDKNGTDIIVVRGIIYSEDSEEIVVSIDVESGGYLFG